MARLTEHQQVPLTPGERADLRETAAAHGISPGIFARALLLHARRLLGDPALTQTITDEKTSAAKRSSDAAAAAAQQRWDK
ncbi:MULTISPECIES: hypothetical protein [Gordonia]|uniref:hypothetical protein n=1 Tax=Gordonia TaxID=2053 RepID=UPI00257D65F0|nr:MULTISPECIES: hypothetical protein [Gordonia]